MSEEDVVNELNSLAQLSDNETAHVKADEVLLDFLKSKGHTSIVAAYENCSKNFWYA